MKNINRITLRIIEIMMIVLIIQICSHAQVADIDIENANQIGINIGSSTSNAVQIVNAGIDGVQVQNAGRDGIRVSNAQGWGIYSTGNLGAARLQGNVLVAGNLGVNVNPPVKLIDVNAGSAASGTQGLRVLHGDGYGGALLANDAIIGGFFVTDGGSNYAPLWANSFNILSDRRLKQNVESIDQRNYHKYISYLENLETVAFHYNHELAESSPHIGIIAQSAPKELRLPVKGGPSGQEEMLSINLADWTGLNTVLIKYLMEENRQMKKDIQLLENQIQN